MRARPATLWVPNTNQWKGAGCVRVNCVPCGQRGDQKQEFRKRNIIYESKCIICNPEQEKGKKERKEQESRKEGLGINLAVRTIRSST